MSDVTETQVKTLLETPTRVQLRPRFEGSNICTWIGFKHDNYLVEEAILEHFRSADLSTRKLYEELGLGLDFVEMDVRILSSLHLDDLVTADVVPWPSERSVVVATATAPTGPTRCWSS